MTHLANYWARNSKEVILITFDDGSKPPFYTLSREIRHIPLGISRFSSNRILGFRNNFKRVLVLHQTIKNIGPDVVISFIDLTNVIILLAVLGLNQPVIVAEHSDPAMTFIGPLWEGLRKLTYPWADKVVVLNEKAKAYFPKRIQKRIAVIPNPVLIGTIGTTPEPVVEKQTVMAMGRLSEEKQLDVLLRAFRLIKERYPDWRVMILGEGPLRGELEALRDRLSITERVDFLGVVKDPHSYLKKADLFVLPSRFEGFPMALCEAMACGLPVISTEYHSGVREIINDGVNGVLVPVKDINSLAATMDRLMGDEAERRRLGTKARDIVHRFGLEKVMSLWEEVIERVQFERKG